jgi:hypothetical protein
MNQPEDRDLQDRFAALRREDAASAPAFTAPRTPALRPPLLGLRLVPALAAVGLAIVLVAGGVLVFRPHRAPLVSLAATTWQSPTDFLLRVPGAEYLETVPRLTDHLSALTHWRSP